MHDNGTKESYIQMLSAQYEAMWITLLSTSSLPSSSYYWHIVMSLPISVTCETSSAPTPTLPEL